MSRKPLFAGLTALWAMSTMLVPCRAAPAADYATPLAKAQTGHAAIADVWYAAVGQMSPAPAVLQIELPRFAQNAALRLEVPLATELSHGTSAWVIDKSVFCCPGSADKLAYSAANGTIRGTITLVLPPEFESGPAASKRIADMIAGRANLPPAQAEEVAITVDAAAKEGVVTGSFACAAAKSKGTVSGRIVRAAEAARQLRALGKLDLKRMGPSEQYALAVALESDTFAIYRWLRALAAAQGQPQKFAGALAADAIPMPVRPPFLKQSPAPAASPDAAPGRGKRPPVKPPRGPSIDDPLDDSAPPPAEPDTYALVQKAIRERLPVVEAIAESVAAMAGVAKLSNAAGHANGEVQRGLTFDDPLFGPWYGAGSLVDAKGGANRLPADVGQAGPQDWSFVHAWQFLGPFEFAPLGWDPLRLPDALPLAGTEFEGSLDTVRWRAAAINAAQCAVLTDLDAYSDAPDLIEEQPTSPATRPGVRVATYYAATTIDADRDCELYMAAGCGGRLAIWINNELVARGPLTDDPGNLAQEAVVFRPRLRKGDNAVLVRCESPAFGLFTHRKPGTASYLWMRICTRGAPGDPRAARATLDAIAKRKGQLSSLPANVRGFRFDQTGFYADADPPTAWDIDRRINVLWTTPIERWSKASPVVVGDKVFVCAEPHVLVCIDATTGKVLWRRSANVLDLIDPALAAASEKLYQEYLDARSAAAPKLSELGSTHAVRIRALVARGLEMPRVAAALREMDREPEKKFAAFYSHLRTSAKMIAPAWDGHFSGPWLGYTFATPVTDGKHVYVQFRTGATAAFDLDGKRLWMVHTPYEAGGTAVCSSPVLADDKLVISQPMEPKRAGALVTLRALEAATGRTVWTARADSRSQTSSPVVMRLTSGAADMTVIATDGGTVVRADDGKVLIAGLSGGCGTGAPTPVGDVLYRVQNAQGGAVRLLMLDRDHVGAQWLWSHNGLYNAIYAGVGHRDGTLFGICHGGSQCISERGLYLISTETGLPIERPFNLDAKQKKQGIFAQARFGFVPPVASKRAIYLALRGQGHASSLQEELPDRWTPYTYVTVAQHGALGRFIAHNKVLGLLTPHPAMAGDRLYLRNDHELTCIGYTGDDGRAYEAEVNAATILDDISDAPPADPQAADLWRKGIEHARPFLERAIALSPDTAAAKRSEALLQRR